MEVYQRTKDAIVDINTISVINDLGEIQQLPGTASGFLICGGYVVTNAHVVFVNPALERVPTPQYRTFARKNLIVVTVYNVGGCGKAYRYNASIVGADRLNDIAVLKLEQSCNLPSLEDHPYLEWGSSRETLPGSHVYVIGNPLGQDVQSIAHGIVRDNRYVDPISPNSAEQVSCDVQIAQGNSGSPLLDHCGKVVGVVFGLETGIGDQPVGLSLCVSQYAAERIVNQILTAQCGWFEPLVDLDDFFLRRLKISLDLAAFYADALSVIFDPETLTFNLDEQPKFNQVVGLYVFRVLNTSPLLGILEPGDLIVKIQGHTIGVISGLGQTSVGNALFETQPGEQVHIVYRKRSEQYLKKHKANITGNAIPIDRDFVPTTIEPVSDADKVQQKIDTIC